MADTGLGFSHVPCPSITSVLCCVSSFIDAVVVWALPGRLTSTRTDAPDNESAVELRLPIFFPEGVLSAFGSFVKSSAVGVEIASPVWESVGSSCSYMVSSRCRSSEGVGDDNCSTGCCGSAAASLLATMSSAAGVMSGKYELLGNDRERP